MLEVDTIDNPDAAGSLATDWDELAVSQGLPLCAPGWMLAWWRHMAPVGSELRVVVVREGGRTIALAPWFADHGPRGRVDLRFLGAERSDRVDILCVPGREREVAAELSGAIRRMRPGVDLVAFEAVPAASGWTRRLARGSLRMARYRNSVIPAPNVSLPTGPEESWLEGRSNHFRKRVRRLHRQLEAQGGRVYRAQPSEVPAVLEAMLELHRARWEGRAESGLMKPGLGDLLREAAVLLGPDRLRLWVVGIEGEPISVQLFLAAGVELKYWNGGWSEQYAELQPTMLTIIAAIEDAIVRGERRLDLGAGTHPYKMRFADGDDPLAWEGLIVRNRRWPQTRGEMTPRVMRYRAKKAVEALPAPLSERIRAAAKSRQSAS
jgi:CelD/BcsL family acetyltransferase involved in cellulose biosynthesis